MRGGGGVAIVDIQDGERVSVTSDVVVVDRIFVLSQRTRTFGAKLWSLPAQKTGDDEKGGRRWLTMALHAATRAAVVAFDMASRKKNNLISPEEAPVLQAMLDQARVMEEHMRKLLVVVTTNTTKTSNITGGEYEVRTLAVTLPLLIERIMFLTGGSFRLSPAHIDIIRRDISVDAATRETTTPGSFFADIVSFPVGVTQNRPLLWRYTPQWDRLRSHLIQAEHLINRILSNVEFKTIEDERERVRAEEAALLVDFTSSFLGGGGGTDEEEENRAPRASTMDLTQFPIGNGIRLAPLLRCARCKSMYYLSKEEQLSDWQRHRLVCIPATTVVSTAAGN